MGRGAEGETGIDNGYRRSGGVHLAETKEPPSNYCKNANDGGARLSVSGRMPQISIGRARLGRRYERCELHCEALATDEVQIRSPRHMQALFSACEKRGVEFPPARSVRF